MRRARSNRGLGRRALVVAGVAAVVGGATTTATAAPLASESFEGGVGASSVQHAVVRDRQLRSAPDGDRVAWVALTGRHSSFSIDALRGFPLPGRGGAYIAAAYVRAAAPSSVGMPVALRVRLSGRGRTKTFVSHARLRAKFLVLRVPFGARVRGRVADVAVIVGAKEPGGAFVTDAVRISRRAPVTRRSAAPSAPSAPSSPAAPAPSRPLVGASPIGGITSFRGDWETGNASQWNKIDCVPTTRLQIVTDHVRQGRYAGRFEVRPGDTGRPPGERCEVMRDWHGDEANGQAYYYAWSTMVAAPWTPVRTYGIFLQFHPPWPYPPTVEIGTDKQGGFGLGLRGGDRDHFIRNSWELTPTVNEGKWNDFVMYVKYGVTDGAIKVWQRVEGQQDFTLLLDKSNVPDVMTYQGVPAKVMMRWGYYRGSNNPGTAVVYQDGMRRGPTLSDVMADFPPS